MNDAEHRVLNAYRSGVGFTLIELLIVISCMAIVLTWGLGGLSNLITRYRIHLLKNQMRHVIQYSRHIAVSKGRDMLLRPLEGDWSRGIVLLPDNPHHRYTQQDEFMQLWQWPAYAIQVDWLGFQSRHFLVFPHDLSHAASNGQFQFSKQGQVLDRLILNRVGRLASE